MRAYSALIQADTNCPPEEVRSIEVVMRDFVVGQSFKSLSRSEFRDKAREAYALLNEERAMVEERFGRN